MNRGNEASGDRNSPDESVMQAPATHIDAPVLKVNVNQHANPQSPQRVSPADYAGLKVNLCGQAAPPIWESIAGPSDRLIVKESVESVSD